MAESLRQELRQTKPFRSLGHEGVLSILRTGDEVKGWIVSKLRSEHFSLGHYNVLRILRGAGPQGLPTLAILDRMIERAPGITRLVDTLEKRKMVRRDRSNIDRRLVCCSITEVGLEWLKAQDQNMDSVDEFFMRNLSPKDARRLIDLLERVRVSQAKGKNAK